MRMTPKELLGLFFASRNEKWRDVPKQMVFARRLCSKYNRDELEMAIEMYAQQMYSLAFLNDRNMGNAIVKLNNKPANITYDDGGEDIATRNKRRIQGIASESRLRTQYYQHMLEE